MVVSLEQFTKNLIESGLLSAAELSAFQDSLPPEQHPQDAEAFARALVEASKLTAYQAQAIYQGKTEGLVLGNYVILEKLESRICAMRIPG